MEIPPPLAETAAPPTRDALGTLHYSLGENFLAEWMRVHVVRASRGDAAIQMLVRPEMLNGFGTVQGGMIFAFADTAFELACNHAERADTMTVAQGADVSFLGPAHAGDTLTAIGTQVHDARSGVYDVEVLAQRPGEAAPRRVALFRGRSRTVPRPPDGG
ncbi:MAG: hotdog fold thioesterase [Pseudoclavibacter sp.]